MNKIFRIFLIIIAISLIVFLLWAAYYVYNYNNNVKKIENNLFTISPQSKNSIEWNSFMILQNTKLINNNPTIDIQTKVSETSVKTMYTIPYSLYNGEGNEFDKFCRVIRIVRYSTNPDNLTFESIECI